MWVAFPFGAVLCVVLVLLALGLGVDPEVWEHVSTHVLLRATTGSLRVALGAALVAALAGTVCGWLSARFDFVGRTWIERFWLVGLAFPPYVSASAWMTLGQTYAPEEASALCLGLAMFPYVYLFTREGFMRIPRSWVEAARGLGASPSRVFFSLRFRLVLPWLFAGASLVALEAMADFGTVGVFNAKTLAIEVYQSWVGLQSIEASARLCLIQVALSCTVWGVFWALERRHGKAVEGGLPEARRKLDPLSTTAAWFFGFFLIAASWGVPLVILAHEMGTLQWLNWVLSERTSVLNSLVVSGVVASLVVLFASLSSYRLRPYRKPGALLLALHQGAQVGYAIPGSVLAIAAFGIVAVVARTLGVSTLVLSAAMILFLALRFLSVGLRPAMVATRSVPGELEDAARGLGAGRLRRMTAVYAPAVAPALKVGWLMVFLDVLKEVPLQMMLRPFGFETLTVRFFQLSLDGLWLDAAAPALTLGVISLIVSIPISRRRTR